MHNSAPYNTLVTPDQKARMREKLVQGLEYQTYRYVRSLIIYWENGDQGFKEEGKKLGNFLESRLGHNVQEFAIPRDYAYSHLSRFIADNIIETNRIMEKRRCPALIILHYGGHGDRNDDIHGGENEESVWAEQEKGGTTVDWFKIQETLRDAKSDLLLLLDCCYALRASQNPLTPHSGADAAVSYHLLAAASHHEETPLPGPGSFTNALLKQLQNHFPEDDDTHNDCLTETQLFREIKQTKNPSLQIQPCHHPFTEGTIRIGPVDPSGSQEANSDYSSDSDMFTIKIKTRDVLTDGQNDQLLRYLTLDRPGFIESVKLMDEEPRKRSRTNAQRSSSTHLSSIARQGNSRSGQGECTSKRGGPSPRVNSELQRKTLESEGISSTKPGIQKVRVQQVHGGYIIEIPTGLAIFSCSSGLLIFVFLASYGFVKLLKT